MSWLITGAEKTPVDPLFNNVSLLLHGDGTNGSTTIVDSSPSPKTVTAVGNAQISTAQSKYGGGSIAFDGTGDYLSIASPSNSIIKWFDSDYTLEYWIYPNGFTQQPASGDSVAIGNMSATSGTNYWSFGPRGDGKIQFYYYTGAGYRITTTAAISTGAWTHLAFVKSGQSLLIFIDGASSANGTLSAIPQINSPTGLSIGQVANTSFNGYIDDLRITKGVARYTSNFTPPTAPFPDI